MTTSQQSNLSEACTASADCHGHFQMAVDGGGSRPLHLYKLDLGDPGYPSKGLPSAAVAVDVDRLGGPNALTFDTTTAPL